MVRESTVCLMGHERRQTLALIEALACRELCARQPVLYAPQPFYVCVCPACLPQPQLAPPLACAACEAAQCCECCRGRPCPA